MVVLVFSCKRHFRTMRGALCIVRLCCSARYLVSGMFPIFCISENQTAKPVVFFERKESDHCYGCNNRGNGGTTMGPIKGVVSLGG